MSGIQPGQRYQMFFWIWALKEAIVKATGDGIRMMNKTDVTPVIGGSCNASSHLLTIDEKPMNFFIYRYSPGKEYLGAAAICMDGKK
jgi:phosphopantetheinyl transferase